MIIQKLYLVHGDKSIKIWDVKSGTCISTLNVWSVAFNHDNTKIVSGSGDNSIKIWQITDITKCTKTTITSSTTKHH